MAGNTGTSTQENQTFTTGVVSLATGVLNPANSAQTVWDCGVGMTYASITTVVTGSPASFTILLEGTYDGTNWSTLATCTNTAGETQYSTGLVPFTNLRARCTAVSGGTSPTVDVFATASQFPITNTGGGTSPATTVNQGAANLGITFGWPVSEGVVNATTTLTAATTTVTGTAVDHQASRLAATFQVVTTGTITAGAITFLGSIDGTTYVILTGAALIGGSGSPTLTNGVLTMTAATTALVSLGANNAAIRFYRADVTTNITGGGSATVKVSAF